MCSNKVLQISLAAARVNKGLTQQHVAKHINVCKKTVINWEKGATAPDVKQFRKLCKLYELEEDNIFLP